MFGSVAYSSSSYRYGFNGMQKDDEIKDLEGSSYDFGARMYDPRLGRWLSIDPLAMKYPELSPYNFVANSPLQYVDPDGREIVPVNKSTDDAIGQYFELLGLINNQSIKYNNITSITRSGTGSQRRTDYSYKTYVSWNAQDRMVHPL